jgi:hypothetical protein
MVGQGVLRECLLDPDVESVLAVVRNASLPQHDKLREIIHQDVFGLAAIEDRLSGYDACFFCLGVSSVGMKEETYRRVTYDLTVSVAKILAKLNPTMTFIYVSGAGTDSPERAKHVGADKGQNGKRAIADAVQGCVPVSPYVHSAASWNSHKDQMAWGGLRFDETPLSVVEDAFPNYVTTTECVGRAMLSVTKQGFPKPVLENSDINRQYVRQRERCKRTTHQDYAMKHQIVHALQNGRQWSLHPSVISASRSL